MNLLTVGNPKTEKGEASGYLTAILHLAPSTLSGFNTCPQASEGCKRACLNTAGRGGIFKRGEKTNAIQKARIRRTRFFFENRGEFTDLLSSEIEAHIRRASRLRIDLGKKKPVPMKPAFRLNGTSDIRWENVTIRRGGRIHRNPMEAFPEAIFYDYTKLENRRGLPSNYSLTFSLSEDNAWEALEAYSSGLNIAVVFSGGLPLHFDFHGMRLPVIDGDKSDLRFLDPSPCIVGLRAKGRAKREASGFVYSAANPVLRLPLPVVSRRA